jgi:hypothetical protein
VPQARGIICHGVDGAGDVGEEGAVAMVALVEGLKAEEGRRGFGGGG